MSDGQSQSLPGDVVARRTDMAQFIEFEVDEKNYAFPIHAIQEIVILKDITPTPEVVACVDGVSNLRGAIIPVINLRVLFGLSRRPPDDETRTIVVNVSEKTMGCTVDRVNRVLRVKKEEIKPAPETITADGKTYISGFIKDEQRLVIVIDVPALLSVDRLRHADSSQLEDND